MYGTPKLINSDTVQNQQTPSPSGTFGTSGQRHPALVVDFDSRYGVDRSGTLINSWQDRVRGIICKAPNRGNRPTYSTNVYNNIPGIVMDASTTVLTYSGRIPELEGQDSLTLLMISLGNPAGSNHNACGSMCYQVAGDYSNRGILMESTPANNDVDISCRIEVNASTGSNRFGRVIDNFGPSNIHIWVWTYNGKVATGTDTFKHSINGADRTLNSAFSAGIPSRTFVPAAHVKCQFNIGCVSDAGGGLFVNAPGKYVRLQMYNEEIRVGSPELKSIVRGLMNDYGLSGKRQVICMGDSRTHNSEHETQLGWVDQCGATVGNAFLMQNAGIGTDTIANALSAQANRLTRQLYTYNQQIICVWYGRNDIDGGATAATVFANLKSYCQTIKTNRADATVIIFTELPSTSSNGSYETIRQTLNTSIRNEVSPPWDYIADIGNDGTIGQAGQNTDTTYYHAGGIHPNFTGDTIIASYVSAILPLI